MINDSTMMYEQKPLSQNHKPWHIQDIWVVTECVDGEFVKTRKPKEEAEKLYRKVRSAGGCAYIKKEDF